MLANISLCILMGSSEVFHYWFLVHLLVTIIIAILSIFSFKNIFSRFGLFKSARREFYECGFKPLYQKPIKLSLQFIIICTFFILYDIELVFSFPLISFIANFSLLDFFVFFILYGSFIFSLIFDYERFLTK